MNIPKKYYKMKITKKKNWRIYKKMIDLENYLQKNKIF